jgi:hypothetical protein
MSFSEFNGYSKDFDSLDNEIKSSISTIVFSKREEVFSICAVTSNRIAFDAMCKNISLPRELFLRPSIKWGVDLESLNTDKIRVYSLLPKSSNIRLYGFYIDASGNIFEKKLYKYKSPTEFLIDRYDGEGNLITSNEHETECSESEWTGPKKLLFQLKASNKYEYNFMKKVEKNQTYIAVHKKN